MNSPSVMRMVQDRRGRAARLADSNLDWSAIVEELFLATLSRFPSDDEQRWMHEALKETNERRMAAEDVHWTLLNTKEFVFCH